MAHVITYVDDKKANIELIRGDTLILTLNFVHVFESRYTKETEPYEPQEGDTAIFTLRSNYKDLTNDNVLVQKIVDLFDDPVLEIEPSDTEQLPYGSYKYDIQFTSADGLVDTPLIGSFKLAKEVT